MDIDDIERLVRLMKENDLVELEIERAVHRAHRALPGEGEQLVPAADPRRRLDLDGLIDPGVLRAHGLSYRAGARRPDPDSLSHVDARPLLDRLRVDPDDVESWIDA